VHRERLDPSVLDQRHDEQVEGHATMDLGKPIGLHDQRWAPGLLVEPGERARVAFVRQEIARALAANAEHLRVGAVAPPSDVAQKRQHASGEPAQ
jgi:hypothetical protein